MGLLMDGAMAELDSQPYPRVVSLNSPSFRPLMLLPFNCDPLPSSTILNEITGRLIKGRVGAGGREGGSLANDGALPPNEVGVPGPGEGVRDIGGKADWGEGKCSLFWMGEDVVVGFIRRTGAHLGRDRLSSSPSTYRQPPSPPSTIDSFDIKSTTVKGRLISDASRPVQAVGRLLAEPSLSPGAR